MLGRAAFPRRAGAREMVNLEDGRPFPECLLNRAYDLLEAPSEQPTARVDHQGNQVAGLRRRELRVGTVCVDDAPDRLFIRKPGDRRQGAQAVPTLDLVVERGDFPQLAHPGQDDDKRVVALLQRLKELKHVGDFTRRRRLGQVMGLVDPEFDRAQEFQSLASQGPVADGFAARRHLWMLASAQNFAPEVFQRRRAWHVNFHDGHGVRPGWL